MPLAALRPWTEPRTWRESCHLTLGPLVGTVTFTLMVTLLSVTAGLLITLPLAVPFAWLTFVVAAGMGRVERSRLQSLLDLDLPSPHRPFAHRSWWRRLLERLGSGSRWREIVYFLVLLPVALVTFLVALATWSAAVALAALPLYVWALPGDRAHLGVTDVGQGLGTVGLCLVGLGLLIAAPWVTRAMALVNRSIAGPLLGGRSRAAQLSAELDRTEASRAAAVDAAAAERRRIERDLHDGAQQRLVALAMDLGQAREKMATDPQGARQLVDDAHEEAKQALVDLRDLVRGIHPAILEDRGLDAALSAVVARCPVTVDLRVSLARRPPGVIENAAYFVVGEALTNVARHSQATRASVSVATTTDRVVIEVTDNGVGGAVARAGGGLAGLADRVSAVGGWFHLMSPPGGPTTVLVEPPCAS